MCELTAYLSRLCMGLSFFLGLYQHAGSANRIRNVCFLSPFPRMVVISRNTAFSLCVRGRLRHCNMPLLQVSFQPDTSLVHAHSLDSLCCHKDMTLAAANTIPYFSFDEYSGMHCSFPIFPLSSSTSSTSFPPFFATQQESKDKIPLHLFELCLALIIILQDRSITINLQQHGEKTKSFN